MKAIIMAGGEGTRLRPLTCDCPKPMVPLMDKPVMEYALALLKQHDFLDVGVTLQYLPNRVKEHFGDGEERGQRIRYYVEEQPLGTAGSVKQAQEFLTETFLVLSGDGLTDCDLTAALRFHREHGAAATMVLKRVEVPLEYGVVVTGQDGRVERFVEKPGWGEVFSDAINTGIYILEPQVLQLVPEGKPYDFGRELFPLLVQMGEPVFGYQMDGYWCDIGDIPAYLRAHMDALDGKVSLINNGKKSGVLKMPGAVIDPGAVVEGPCFIGAGAKVAEGARIGPYSVIGGGSQVQGRAGVKRAVIWRGATVQSGAQLRGCILQDGAVAGLSGTMFEESVLAGGSVLGEGATLMPGVKVWPSKQVADGERLMKNMVWGGSLTVRYEGGELALIRPSDAIVGADALCAALMPEIVIVGRDASMEAMAHARAATASLMASGPQVIDVGAVTIPQLRHAMRGMGGDAALWIAKNRMIPLGKHGLPLIKAQHRKLQSAVAREEQVSPFAQGTLAPIQVMRTDIAYMNKLAESVQAHLLKDQAMPVAVHCQNPLLLSLAERVMRRAGLTVRCEWEEEMMDLGGRELGVWLSADGEGAEFSDRDGKLSATEGQMLLSWTAIQLGAKHLVVPRGATGGIIKLAESAAVPIIEARSDRADYLASLIGEDEQQFLLMTDGIFAALKVVEQLTKNALTLRGVKRTMPVLHRQERTIPMELREKGPALKGITERYPDCDQSDGIRIEDERGWAWISPLGDRRSCLVVSESFDQEVARELCDFYAKELDQLVKAGKGKG